MDEASRGFRVALIWWKKPCRLQQAVAAFSFCGDHPRSGACGPVA